MTPEVETRTEIRRTGHHLLDFIVGGSALLISVISLVVAIGHGKTMERLVEANSRPFVEVESSNAEMKDPTKGVVVLRVVNAGAGPARLENFHVLLDDKEYPTTYDAVHAVFDEAKRAGVADVPNDNSLTISSVAPWYLRGGDSLAALRFERTEANAALWKALDKARDAGRIHLKICYCSIFDDCWIADSKVFRPQPVKQCEAQR